MEGPIVGVYGIIVMFFVLFLLRIPVGFTMALVGFLGICLCHFFQGSPRNDRDRYVEYLSPIMA